MATYHTSFGFSSGSVLTASKMKYQANFASTLVLSGDYGATWGFRFGSGHSSNVIGNITLYTMASTFIRFKGRNANTSSSGDTEFPMHIAIWQE
jgi:hypothetical protein